MALIVTVNGNSEQFHVDGFRNAFFFEIVKKGTLHFSVTADGHEGQMCINAWKRVTGQTDFIDSPINYMVHYYGDFARTILMNL